MRRIKIFYFIPNLAQGGPERQLLILISQLPKRFQPILCLYHDDIFFRNVLPPNQPRYVLGTKKMNFKALGRLTDIIRKEKPDIVHSFRDKSNFWARIAALRAGTPIIISSCRNRMIELRYLLVEKLLSDRCQMVLTNSTGVRNELINFARVNPDLIRVIYNILDVDFFRPPSLEERKISRNKLNLADEQITLVLPGRIGLQKHQIGLLFALKNLASKNMLPKNLTLLLVGRKRDKRTSFIVDKLSQTKFLNKTVRFLDAQEDIRSVYWASDILIMPSLWEGLSNAALEGCACGLPAILSHAANVDQVVEHEQSSLEVPTGNHFALCKTIEHMLHLSINQRKAMGLRNREHVIQRFVPHKGHVVNKIIEIYDELLSQNILSN